MGPSYITSARPRCTRERQLRDGVRDQERGSQDANPGYSQIRIRANVESDATPEALQALHDHVVRTSLICSTVARPVAVTAELAAR